MHYGRLWFKSSTRNQAANVPRHALCRKLRSTPKSVKIYARTWGCCQRESRTKTFELLGSVPSIHCAWPVYYTVRKAHHTQYGDTTRVDLHHTWFYLRIGVMIHFSLSIYCMLEDNQCGHKPPGMYNFNPINILVAVVGTSRLINRRVS